MGRCFLFLINVGEGTRGQKMGRSQLPYSICSNSFKQKDIDECTCGCGDPFLFNEWTGDQVPMQLSSLINILFYIWS
jgi:hypothetical protein